MRLLILTLNLPADTGTGNDARAFLWDNPVTTRSREIVELYVENVQRLVEALVAFRARGSELFVLLRHGIGSFCCADELVAQRHEHHEIRFVCVDRLFTWNVAGHRRVTGACAVRSRLDLTYGHSEGR